MSESPKGFVWPERARCEFIVRVCFLETTCDHADVLAAVEADVNVTIVARELIVAILRTLDLLLTLRTNDVVLCIYQPEIISSSQIHLILVETIDLHAEVLPALGTRLEVIVRSKFVESLKALPAEVDTAVLADHFVASFRLLDGEIAVWTLFRTVVDVEKVESFLQADRVNADHGLHAALVRVILPAAQDAELEPALRAFAFVRIFVNFGGGLALELRAPSELVALLDHLRDRDQVPALDQLIVRSDSFQVFLRDRCPALPRAVGRWTDELVDLALPNVHLNVLPYTVLAESVTALPE